MDRKHTARTTTIVVFVAVFVVLAGCSAWNPPVFQQTTQTSSERSGGYSAGDGIRIQDGVISSTLGDSVDGQEIDNESVTSADLAQDSVGQGELGSDSVGNSELASSSVGSGELQSGAVGRSKLGSNAVTSGKISDGSVSNADLGADSVDTGELASSSVDTDEIAGDAVNTSSIADGGVQQTDLSTDSVTGQKISNGTISFADLGANGCVENQVAVYDGSSWVCGDMSGGGPHDHLGETWEADVEGGIGLEVNATEGAAGIAGYAPDGIGVRGQGNTGILARGGDIGLEAVANVGGHAIIAEGRVLVLEGLEVDGTTTLNENLSVRGRSDVIQPVNGDTIVYTSVVAGEVRTEVSGVAELDSDGQAFIDLPIHFLEMTDMDRDLVVQVTPYSALSGGLAVEDIDYGEGVVKVGDLGSAEEYKFAYTVKGIREGHGNKEILQK